MWPNGAGHSEYIHSCWRSQPSKAGSPFWRHLQHFMLQEDRTQSLLALNRNIAHAAKQSWPITNMRCTSHEQSKQYQREARKMHETTPSMHQRVPFIILLILLMKQTKAGLAWLQWIQIRRQKSDWLCLDLCHGSLRRMAASWVVLAAMIVWRHSPYFCFDVQRRAEK